MKALHALPRTRKLMLVAGEMSGDAYLGELVQELKKQSDCYEFSGMGGMQMRKAGVRLLADCTETSVVGIFEVGEVYRRLRRNFNKLLAEMKEHVDLLILADFPDFNLKLAAKARALKVKVLFFISPQIWAWRPQRLKKIASCVDMMCVIFPFEERIYQEAGIPCCFIGHPLAKTIARAKLDDNLRIDETSVLLMPGSRAGEIKQHLPILCEVARAIRNAGLKVHFTIPLAPGIVAHKIQQKLDEAKVTGEVREGPLYPLMKRADLAITASGTATVELALCKTPMIAIYKVQSLTYFILKRLISTPYISMPNIMAGKTIVPEFVQKDAVPEKISATALRILRNKKVACQMREDLGEVVRQFKDKDAILSLCGLVSEFFH